jgi:hypothetical protein
MKRKVETKMTLNIIGVFMTPIGMFLAQINKPVGAAILGSAVTFILVGLSQQYELRKKK